MNERTDYVALIDRLASGDLDAADRRDLFVWLDREPSRWRRCALAMLEARELDEAFAAWQADAPQTAAELPPVTELVFPRKVVPVHRSAFFALAASLLVAFFLGVVARGFWVAPTPRIAQAPPAGSETSEAEDGSEKVAKRATPLPDRPVADQPIVATARADLLPAYVRSQLERRGYQVSSSAAQIPLVLPDGQHVMFPVDQLRLNYVGHRTY